MNPVAILPEWLARAFVSLARSYRQTKDHAFPRVTVAGVRLYVETADE